LHAVVLSGMMNCMRRSCFIGFFGVLLGFLLVAGALSIMPSRQVPLPPVSVPVPTPTAPSQHQAHLIRPPRPAAPNIAVSGGTLAVAPAEAPADECARVEEAIDGEYALTFFNARDRAAFEAMASRYGIRIIDRLAVANALRITAPDADALRALLKAAPMPLTFLPNIHVRLPPLPEGPAATAPDVPYTGFGNGALAWLGVPDPASDWGRGIRVAVLDTGIPSAFPGRVGYRVDLTGTGFGQAQHGGAVASLISGLQGMVPGAELLDIKVLTDGGSGDAFTLARGIIEAVDRGARLINISAGTRGDSPVLRAAVAYAIERKVMLIAAAGNDGRPGVLYPAGYEGVVAVGGVDAAGRHLYFSNTGSAVDLSAPGIGIAVPAAQEGALASFSGTSAATPFVTAAAALLLAETPSLAPPALLALLQGYSNDAEAPGRDDATGAGILDAGRLLARNEPGLVDMTAYRPYLQSDPPPGRIRVDVIGQNRGTVVLPEVIMEITLDGQVQTLRFRNIGVADITVHTLDLPAPVLDQDGLDVTIHVRPAGLADIRPQDNIIRAVLLPQIP